MDFSDWSGNLILVLIFISIVILSFVIYYIISCITGKKFDEKVAFDNAIELASRFTGLYRQETLEKIKQKVENSGLNDIHKDNLVKKIEVHLSSSESPPSN